MYASALYCRDCTPAFQTSPYLAPRIKLPLSHIKLPERILRSENNVLRLILSLVGCFILSSAAWTADWTNWRGPNGHGSIDEGSYPRTLDESTLIWKAQLPGKGCSTPIVLNDTIYVTAPSNGKDALIAFDKEGSERWITTFSEEDPGKHRNGSGSNSSPVTDGDAIFVYYKSGTLAAVELDGEIRWQTNLVDQYGKDTLYWDHGTSPVLTDDDVVIARMHNGESWLAAFDKKSGKLHWKEPRNFQTPQEGDHGYSTPLVIDYNGKQSLLVWGAEHLTIHNASDGKVTWTCGQFNPDANRLWPSITMPVIVDDIAVITFGRNDRSIPRMFGIKLEGSGDTTDASHVWLRDDISSFVPSPAVKDGKVYLVRDRGEVECVDPSNGQTIWSNRFPKNRSNYYSSPLIAGDTLFAPREDGFIYVANVANNAFELLSENDMKESVIGSPVPLGNNVLIRGEKHLFCFGNR